MRTLYYNGTIASLDNKDNFYNTMGIEDTKIITLDNLDDINSIKSSFDNLINLHGQLLLPGFNDSHLHILGYGMTSNMLLLEDVTSIDGLIRKAQDYIKNSQLKPGSFILGRGWNQDKLIESRFPTKNDLDKISTAHSIILRRVCGHVAVCNSKALSMITTDISNHSSIDTNTGTFKEDALDILNNLTPLPTVDGLKKYIKVAIKEMNSFGFTSGQSDDFCVLPENHYQLVLDAYEALMYEEDFNLRIHEQCLLPNIELFDEFLKKGYKTGYGNSHFKIGPLKLLLDGALGSRTAKLSEPYLDDVDNTGIAIYTQDYLNQMVQKSQDNNMPVAIHGIGSGAIDMIIDAIKLAQKNSELDLRHGIVHCQLTTEKHIEDMADLNIMALVQPIFLDYDLHVVEDRIGPDKAQHTYNFKTMLEKGIHVSGGSDAPVVHFNIFDNLYSAITRSDLSGHPENGWLPKEKLTMTQALKLFTIEGAYASGEEAIKGTLEIGKLADFTIIDKNLFTISHKEIRQCHVTRTVLGGRVVYQK